MSQAMNDVNFSKTSGNPRQTKIGRLVEIMEEFYRVAETADEGAIKATHSDSDDGKLLAGVLTDLQVEADDRASAIADAIATLEPETLGDVIAMLAIAYCDLDIWLANYLPETPAQCLMPTDKVEAARVEAAKRGSEEIQNMLAAAIRGIKGNGGKLPPLVDRMYCPPVPEWLEHSKKG